MFQEDPTLFARALEQALGVDFPPIRAVSVINADLTEVKPLARWVDTPLLVESDTGDRFVVIIESQSREEKAKHLSWPYYVSHLNNKFGCPALLVVVTADVATAKWAREPIEMKVFGRLSQATYPLVLAPDNVPVIRDAGRVRQDVMMAVLSALTHRHEPHVDGILNALAEALDGVALETAMFLATFTEAGLGDAPAAQIWRALMATMTFPYQSHLWQKGREEGRISEAVTSVLEVLSARGLEVPAAVERRIRAQTNVDVLRTLRTRAVTIERAEDLFDG
ncbi:MAG TPA: hypothetical protein VIL37_04175 [Natronosporangium sp.]